MEHHVGIAVTVQTGLVGNALPAENQGPAGDQPVHVVAVADRCLEFVRGPAFGSKQPL